MTAGEEQNLNNIISKKSEYYDTGILDKNDPMTSNENFRREGSPRLQHKVNNTNQVDETNGKGFILNTNVVSDSGETVQIGDSNKPKCTVSNDYDSSSYSMDQINSSYHTPQTFHNQPNGDNYNCGTIPVQQNFDVLSVFENSKQPDNLNNNNTFVINDNIGLQTDENIDEYTSYLNQYSVKPCSTSNKRTYQENQNIHTYSKSSCHNDAHTSSTFSTAHPKVRRSFIGVSHVKGMFI